LTQKTPTNLGSPSQTMSKYVNKTGSPFYLKLAFPSMSNRQRITITIREDLLHALDSTIDFERIRNRSHALESILTKNFSSHTKQAVILASGQGVKMRPFTYELPKPLIPVNNKPLIEHELSLLNKNGFKKVIITVSHLADKIKKALKDGSHLGLDITYVQEKKPTGTGGALRAARQLLDNSPFVVMYGDVLLDLDINEFCQAHSQNKSAVGTLALTSVADPSTYGAVKLRGSRIMEFSEKPTISNDVSRLVFAGCAVFNRSIFNYLPQTRQPLSLEQDIFPKLVKQGRLFAFPFEGQWFDVSTPKIYEQVLKNWQK